MGGGEDVVIVDEGPAAELAVSVHYGGLNKEMKNQLCCHPTKKFFISSIDVYFIFSQSPLLEVNPANISLVVLDI